MPCGGPASTLSSGLCSWPIVVVNGTVHPHSLSFARNGTHPLLPPASLLRGSPALTYTMSGLLLWKSAPGLAVQSLVKYWKVAGETQGRSLDRLALLAPLFCPGVNAEVSPLPPNHGYSHQRGVNGTGGVCVCLSSGIWLI